MAAYQQTKKSLARAFDVTSDNVLESARTQILANAVVPRTNIEGYVKDIGKLWKEAQEKFIVIGRQLVMAKKHLPHGEFERMISSMLPFGASVARKLRTVAEAVDNGRISQDTLPQSYATAYEIAALPDEELMQAERRRLVRPDVTRREIDQFKKDIRRPANDLRQVLLVRERDKLLATLLHARTRLDEIEQELKTIRLTEDA